MLAYVAGPFFSDEQVESLKQIEFILDTAGIEMFRPRLDAGQIKEMKNASAEDISEVFNNDIAGLMAADFIIADLTFKDTGTAFEIGVAWSNDKPILLFNNESVSGKKINLMLAAIADNYFNSFEELDNFCSKKFDKTCKERINSHELDIE